MTNSKKKGKKGATSDGRKKTRGASISSVKVVGMDALSQDLQNKLTTGPCAGRADSPKSETSSSHRKSRSSGSRIPLYVKNGAQPHHSPLHSPAHSRSRAASCDLHPSPNSGRILPEAVVRQQQEHNRSNHMKPPVAAPAAGNPNSRKGQQWNKFTPSSSRRTSSGISETRSTTASDVRSGFRFEDYVPLCQLQKELQKGQVVEGILRINPKNWEDAYISAPGEAMDIYVAGAIDRNRALNGDKVAVEIKSPSEWRILYETLKSNWTKWQHIYEQESSDHPPNSKSIINKTNGSQVFQTSDVIAERSEMGSPANQQESAQENNPVLASKKKKKRLRKHNRCQKVGSETTGQEDDVLSKTAPTAKNSSKKNKSGKKVNSKVLCKDLVEEKTASSHAKLDAGASDEVNGLPRSLLSMTVPQVMKYSFSRFCIQKKGKVISVLQQNHSRIAGGKLSPIPGSDWFKFSPQDPRIPRFRIPGSKIDPQIVQNMDHNTHCLFLATITDWPQDSQMPTGELTKYLGEAGDIDAESQLLLMENKVIDEPFPPEVDQCLDAFSDWCITDDVRDGRRDFTSTCVFTIDPLTARDLDDALSIVPLDMERNGKRLYEVGVHIADVAYFVKEDTPLDSVAAQRSTSYYLVQRVIPMLPRLLCEKLCSLTPGVEKLTFSVVWKMDTTGKIFDTWFGRSVIRSCAKMAYEDAQAMIDDPKLDPEEHRRPEMIGKWSKSDAKQAVLLFHQIASNLRASRFANGALKIDKVKFNFVLDSETGLPSGFSVGQRQEANFLVEEFMLLANMSVGQQILSAFPEKAILRRHPPPDEKQMRDIKVFCELSGLEFNPQSAGSIHQTMEALRIASPANSQVISLLLLKSMKNALYFCAGSLESDLYPHYALNVPVYTHFTSPIRRYPDILVHRLLAASLKYQAVTRLLPEELSKMTGHCNDRKQASRLVSEGSQRLFLALFLQATPVVEEAVVNSVLDRAFDVIVLKFGMVSRVYLDHLDLKGFQFESKSGKRVLHLKWHSVANEAPIRQTIQTSSVVRVRLSVHPEDRTKILAALLPPVPHS